MNIQTF